MGVAALRPVRSQVLGAAGAAVAALVLTAVLLRDSRGFCGSHSASLFFAAPFGPDGAQDLVDDDIRGAAVRHRQACPTSAEVASSPWASSCNLVNKVCVDQGGLILYDDRYQPAPNGGGEEAPTFAAEGNYGQYIYTYRTGHSLPNYPLASIPSRGQAVNEGADYLRQPHFSNCTVPVVWYPFWMTNFGHFLRDNAAKLFGFIEDTPWRDSIKLVPVTADGLALPGFNYQLLQAMSPLRVETWADFTTRLPPGAASHVQPGPLPSAEGDHQRCFESMLICTQGLNITRWPLHGYGRHVVETYRHLLPPDIQERVDTPSSVVAAQDTASVAAASGQAAPAGEPEGEPAAADELGKDADAATATPVLNVVFQRRQGDTRQILNIAELLRRCNAWRHTIATGRTLTANCWEIDITDLVSGMAAAQLADVMVGVHGANLANGWLMRPGSSMIEVQAFGFDTHPPHLQDPLFNAMDKESQVLWWVLQGCDPGAWQPSPAEAAGVSAANQYAKNRNVVVRWEALETALRQVAETGGDMQRYWELWRSGQWWWHVNAGNVTFGGDHHAVCATSERL